MKAGERADAAVRMAYLLRIHSYLDIAIVSMWTVSPRVDIMLGMAEASLRGDGPGGEDEGLLQKIRALVGEARGYQAEGDFPAAMGRMRVALDLVALHIISLSGE
ncbi:MAG: hypothetical protein M3151_02930 [Actinomycetota bacterium]|nr:hypothetical protein [Actinomycetota bacterium]